MSPFPQPVVYGADEIAANTYLVRLAFVPTGATDTMYQSSMVIAGEQPVIVDTGPAAASDAWLACVFGIVEPQDVRWVFVSHIDSDHSGNVIPVLAACPNATLVTSSAAVGRLTSSFDLPWRRTSWMREGETIDAGDRTLEIVDPPIYDSPTTHGLMDRSTGAMWAVDAFAAPVPVEAPPVFADALPSAGWEAAVSEIGIAGNPWLEGIRPEWFSERLDRFMSSEPTVVASAHGPALRGDRLERAVELYRDLPGRTPPVEPGRSELAELLRTHHP